MNNNKAAKIPRTVIIGVTAKLFVNNNHSETNILKAGKPARDKHAIVANISFHLLAK